MKKIILIIAVLLIIISGYAIYKDNSVPEENNMVLKNKKILMVIAPVDFRDEEYLEPRQVLESAGAAIDVASIQKIKARGVGGTEVDVNLTTGDINVDDYDAVVFVGGAGMEEILDDESLQVLALKFYNAQKLTTAICVAPAILAKAGILDGKQATSWPGVKADLQSGGAGFTGEDVTIFQNIITADGPDSAKKFGKK